jgi:NADH-quinone oxidoreductase subunit L
MVEAGAHGDVGAAIVSVGYLRWLPLLPFVGAIVHLSLGQRLGRKGVGFVACAAVAGSLALAVRGFLELSGGPTGISALSDSVYTWMQCAPLRIDVALRLDPLSAVMCLVVTGVGFLIHVYSTGYMGHDPDYARYFAYLNLFTSAMLVLVLADSLPVMFVGWEGVGLCSYLLIGFWYQDDAKASAGKKAFIVNRVGDTAFVVGVLLLFWALTDIGHPGLDFVTINANAAMLPAPVALAAALLLFAGATGKSAQLPLFVWLPEAMAGPTPVSALIHAATMVTAGVYMVVRLSPLYLAAPAAMAVVATVGAVTAVGAAAVGLVQTDIKRVLAYSTISQLGYMFLAAGVGAFGAAIFHVVTHAFFKALLFLGSGSVIHALHEQQDIRFMGGLRRRLPLTWGTFVVGTLAIAGVPLFSGFFSKDEILAATFAEGHYGLWLLGMFGAGLTAFYMTRLLVLTFHGEFRGPEGALERVHESPASMTSVLVALAVLAALGGLLGAPAILGGENRIGHFLGEIVGHAETHLSPGVEWLLMALSVGVAASSMILALRLYARGTQPDEVFARRARSLHSGLTNAYHIDEAYNRGIVGNCYELSLWLWRRVDSGVIDALANGTAAAFRFVADSWRRWATGNLQDYALSVLVGVAIAIVAVAFGVTG